MIRSCLKRVILIGLFVLFMYPVFAAQLSLTSIGALDLGGMKYSEWWYTGTNPKFVGTVGNGEVVSISIDGESETVTANSSGDWDYTTVTPAGDYEVVISSGEESYSFTLHTGQSVTGESVVESTSSGVPATGFNQIYWILFSLAFIGYGYLTFRKTSVSKLFERDAIKD